MCAVNEVMPGRRSVFKNLADYCSVEIEKLFIWNSRSLKLLQITDPTDHSYVSSDVLNNDR